MSKKWNPGIILQQNCTEDFRYLMQGRLKHMTDIEFMEHIIDKEFVETYLEKRWWYELAYTVAMMDYLCRENDIEPFEEYELLRTIKLPIKIYPRDVLLSDLITGTDNMKKQAEREAIPEFMRHNIVEPSVRWDR